ncbi:MAG: sulfatase [Cephaloticoccus sp.]|nr:sulfatase [Cephaloticoccus sp.]MCF7761945.1 sulfatase [Cephaloticoccus sp.]
MSSERSLSQPNIIWIFGDQHRGQALGFRGDPNVRTPHLDRLAREGVCFDRAISGSPLCCPFRGSLISGLYAHEAVPGHVCPLDPAIPTVAHAFNEQGYNTAYFGKWHLDGFNEREASVASHIVPPVRRGGFRTWCAYQNNTGAFNSHVHGGEGETAFHRQLPGFETDVLTDLFIEQLRADATAGQPFFSVLSVQPPHQPYVAPEEWMGRYNPAEIILRPNVPPYPAVQDQVRRDLAGYYAMIENLDWNLGRIRAALDELGLAYNTHIVFFSDHGDMHGSHGHFRKTSPHEESIRIPCIIGGNVPGLKTGVRDHVFNHVDFAPTSLGLCGLDIPAGMVGTDYSAERLTDRTAPEYPDSAYLQMIGPTAFRFSVDRPWRGIVTRDGWKYIVLEGQPWMLFNLNEDPYELVNLAHTRGFTKPRQKLQAELKAWIERTGDNFTLPALSQS